MPVIRPSSDLRNNYSDISAYCHNTQDPVFITKNGAGDLVVMSMDLYERLVGIHSLRKELDRGLADIERRKTVPAEEFFAELKKDL